MVSRSKCLSLLLLGTCVMGGTYIKAGQPSAMRDYAYVAGGLGFVLATPFLYDLLYYKVAPSQTINRDARALMTKIRIRYPQIEQLVRLPFHEREQQLRKFVNNFFTRRKQYDGMIRRWGLFAPQSNVSDYFNWRTRPFLYQLTKYRDAVTDHRLARELEAIHAVLEEIDQEVRSMPS